MPVPHEVTNDFFIHTEDESLFENENQSVAQMIEERIGNLLFLFNLIDATFGRPAPDDLPPRGGNEGENNEDEGESNGDEDENEHIPENEMYDEETDHMTENTRVIPINNVTENESPPADGENDHQEGENAHLTRNVIRLDEFDLLALPFLLMRSRASRNEESAPRQNNQSQESNPNENEQDDQAMDPLLRIFSRTFVPHH